MPPLAETEAVELFCARSQLEPTRTIAELCRRLDDLPLAVELAAARTTGAVARSRSSSGSRSGSTSCKGGRDADPRQQTLRATIEWSLRAARPRGAAALRPPVRLRGGCTLEAAEEVADADLDTLQSLVEKSLVRFTDDRYWMLETIREYAGERLEGSGDADELRRRHGIWITGLALAAESELERGDQATWLGRLESERDNIRAALGRWEELGDRRRDPGGSSTVLAILVDARLLGRGSEVARRRSHDAGESAIGSKALRGAVFIAYLQLDYEATQRLAERQLEGCAVL